MYKKYFKLLLRASILVFLLTSCVVKTPAKRERNTLKLIHLLQSLDSNISTDEATRLSRALFSQTALLSQRFKMTTPPQYHNFLVNVGLKEKGLCYHWSDALYDYFIQEKYPSFEFHLMGVYIGEYWREHNTFMVSAKDKAINEGIVIDPWRHSGEIFFSKVVDDTKYHWVHRPSRGCSKR